MRRQVGTRPAYKQLKGKLSIFDRISIILQETFQGTPKQMLINAIRLYDDAVEILTKAVK